MTVAVRVNSSPKGTHLYVFVDTTLLALAPGAMYTGPPVSDLCQCSSVMYSVISACAACQQDVLVDTCVHMSRLLLPLLRSNSGGHIGKLIVHHKISQCRGL